MFSTPSRSLTIRRSEQGTNRAQYWPPSKAALHGLVAAHCVQSTVAFRMALKQRLRREAESTGLGLARLRKRVAFELFLRRLVEVAPNRWVLKGALALDLRLDATTRPTKYIDLERGDDKGAAIQDIAATQQLDLDDFFTFATTRTDAFDEADEFQAS